MGDLPLGRGVKASFIGGAFGAFFIILCRWSLRMGVGFDDILAATTAGAVSGFIPALCLPRGFSLPNDITTVFWRGISALSWWALAYGILKGRIHKLPGRNRLSRDGWFLWEQEPVSFIMAAFAWIVVGSISAGVPIFYYRKALRETSSLSDAEPTRPVNGPWSHLPITEAIAVSIIVLSCLLVLMYVSLVFGP